MASFERPRSGELEPKDTTLFSDSSIGSPSAFSTAIKPAQPPGGGSSHASTADSSLVEHGFSLEKHLPQTPQSHMSPDVPGRLSLDSTASMTENRTATGGLDDTSVAILDLEAMQDSSMTQFLTSPRTSQQFHLNASTLSSRTPSPNVDTSEPRATPVDVHQDDSAGGEGGEEDIVGIPQEFLERATSASTTDYSSQSSGDDYPPGEGEPPGTPPPLPHSLPPSSSSSLPRTRPSGDGHENEPIRTAQLVSSSLSRSPPPLAAIPPSLSIPVDLSATSIGAEVTIPAHGQPPSGSKHFYPPLRARPAVENGDADGRMGGVAGIAMGGALPPIYPGTHSEMENLISQLLGGEDEGGLLQQLGVHREGEEEEEGAADATLLADELEPTLMREADEFSQYEPTHLASMLNRDSLLRSTRPPVTAGQDSAATHPLPPSASPDAASERAGVGRRSLECYETHVPPDFGVGGRHGSFPASIDRYGVLHGNVRVSEHVRPVADGFTERDVLQRVTSLTGMPASVAGLTAPSRVVVQSKPEGVVMSVSSELSGSRTGVERHVSEGYFSGGYPGERRFVGHPWQLKEEEEEGGDGGSVSSDSEREYASALSDEGPSSPLPPANETTAEGLPSAYLFPTSPPDTSIEPSLTMDTTGLLRTAGHIGSPSPSNGASLASSLDELAMTLGTNPSEPLRPDPEEPGGLGDGLESAAWPSQSSGKVYNPFDSDENVSVGSFGQVEFQGQTSESFQAQLAKDEEELQKASVPFSQALSFDHDLTGTSGIHFTDSTTKDVSIGTYFQKKSHSLGVLSKEGSRLPPSERPKFSDSDSHIIQSPQDKEMAQTLQSGGEEEDTTIVGDASSTSVSPPQGPSTVLPRQPWQPGTGTDGGLDTLTPVVTVHTPFPAQFQIPKLDLGNVSTASTATLTSLLGVLPVSIATDKARSTVITSLAQSLPPYLSSVSTVSTGTSAVPHASVASSSPGTTGTVTYSPGIGMGSRLSTTGMDSRLSSGLLSGLPSRYLKPSDLTTTTLMGGLGGRDVTSDSTLIFPELAFSPSPGREVGSFMSFPTPSMAHLSPGFDLTETMLPDTSYTPSLPPTVGESPIPPRVHFARKHEAGEEALKGTTTASRGSQLLPPSSPEVPDLPSSPLETSGPVLQHPGKTRPKPARLQQHAKPPSAFTSRQSPSKSDPKTPLERKPIPRSLSASLPPSTTVPSSTQQRSSLPLSSARLHQPPASSPSTEAARKKIADLQATLEATRFDAEAFLANLKGSVTPKPSTYKSAVVSPPRQPDSKDHSHLGTQRSTPTSPQRGPPHTPPTSRSVLSPQTTPPATTALTSSLSPRPPSETAPSQQLQTSTPETMVSIQTTPTAPPTTSHQETQPGTTEGALGQVLSPGVKLSKSQQEVGVRGLRKGESTSPKRIPPRQPGSLKRRAYSTGDKWRESGSRVGNPPSSQTSRPPQIDPPKSSEKLTKSQLPSLSTSLSSPPLSIPSSSPDKPIYTSPHVHPHTSQVQLHTSPQTRLHTSPLSHHHLPPARGTVLATGHKLTPEKASTLEADSLKVPNALCFDSVCCVGASLVSSFPVTNSGNRWLQLNFDITRLYRNGSEVPCSTIEPRLFSYPRRCFIGPGKTEPVKVTFSPLSHGNYEAVLSVQSTLVVRGEHQSGDGCLSSVVLKALAEKPQLKVLSSHHGSPALDYGVLVGGASHSLPLQLANHGSSDLPLRLTVTASTLSQLYFSFDNVPPSLLPSSPHTNSQPYSTSITLPAKKRSQVSPSVYSLDVQFKAPQKYFDDTSELGPPDEVSAAVDIAVDGPNAVGNLCSVPLRALVGVARLHVPRSMQAMSLACTTGQSVAREVPFKNAGNVPVRVRLKVTSDTDHFTVTPDFLLMEPVEEVQVSVRFSSPSPVTTDGQLLVNVEPCGPKYEMRLRGTATAPATHQAGLLACSKRSLFWGGVKLGSSMEQRVVLHNRFQNQIPLMLSLRHTNSAFQLQSVGTMMVQSTQEQEIDIMSQEQLCLSVIFTPLEKKVYSSALDISDTAHSKKYRIPLFGYGGTSQVEVVNARRSPQGSWINMGEVVANQRNVVKVSLYNSGERAAFVKAICYSAEDPSLLLPLTKVSVSPAEVIVQPQNMKELLVIYHASESDETKCVGFPSPLVQLTLLSGDEIVRQRLLRSVSVQDGKAVSPLVRGFLKQFPDQGSITSELDLSSHEVEDEEKFFEHQLRRLSISLSGSPPSENPIPPPFQASPTTPFVTTTLPSYTHLTHVPSAPSPSRAPEDKALSPSHTPGSHVKDHTHKQHFVSSHALILPDTPLGHYSEKFLDIHNPCSHPLKWTLTSVASPFVRKASEDSRDIYKSTYAAFWVHERRGTILPQTTAKVLVTFQPHDLGSFSQIWDLQVFSDETDMEKLRLSFGGKAVATSVHRRTDRQGKPRVAFQDASTQSHSGAQVQRPHSGTMPATANGTSAGSPQASPPRRTVFLRDESVEFPLTKVGEISTVKVRVCNKDYGRYQFEVIKPTPPFSVSHHSFELGTRQCARLPVHFGPTLVGEYEGILAVRTNAGHQTFTVLRGRSLP